MRSKAMVLCAAIMLIGLYQTSSALNDIHSLENTYFPPELEITALKGGIGGITIEIRNIGDEETRNIQWSGKIEGGLFGRISTSSQGTITSIMPQESKSVKIQGGIGLGPVKIEVNVQGKEKIGNGMVFLIFYQIFPGLVLEFETIAQGLNSPVVLTHAGDGSNRLFVVDQIGIIYTIENHNLLSVPFLDIREKIVPLDPVYDERGLLGLTFHPNYENNGKLYVYYSAAKNAPGLDHESILSEFTVMQDNRNQADKNSEKIILRIDQPESNHNGGQIEFGPDGYLYIGVGDGGGAGDQHGRIGNGQNISTLLGSILRIDIDGGDPYAIPPDNPFVGTKGQDEIYAYGFRNPWKFSFDRQTGELIVADVGQDEWEELDFVIKGGNYGWKIMEGFHPYDPELADFLGIDIESLEKPFHEYSHAVGRSITGGYVYRGTQLTKLVGTYVFGDWSTSFVLPNGKLFYLLQSDDGAWERYEFTLASPFRRFVLSFGEDEQGEIYVLSKTTLGPTGETGDVKKMIVK